MLGHGLQRGLQTIGVGMKTVLTLDNTEWKPEFLSSFFTNGEWNWVKLICSKSVHSLQHFQEKQVFLMEIALKTHFFLSLEVLQRSFFVQATCCTNSVPYSVPTLARVSWGSPRSLLVQVCPPGGCRQQVSPVSPARPPTVAAACHRLAC